MLDNVQLLKVNFVCIYVVFVVKRSKHLELWHLRIAASKGFRWRGGLRSSGLVISCFVSRHETKVLTGAEEARHAVAISI